jgi:hypothetical protein
MDVDRLNALEKEWGEEPLTHRLMAAWVGYKPKKKGKPIDLLTMFPEGSIK